MTIRIHARLSPKSRSSAIVQRAAFTISRLIVDKARRRATAWSRRSPRAARARRWGKGTGHQSPDLIPRRKCQGRECAASGRLPVWPRPRTTLATHATLPGRGAARQSLERHFPACTPTLSQRGGARPRAWPRSRRPCPRLALSIMLVEIERPGDMMKLQTTWPGERNR